MPRLFLRGQFIGEVNCILFDKDGTLVNSQNYLYELASLRIQEALKRYKQISLSKDSFINFQNSLHLAYGLKNNEIHPNSSIAIASRDQNLISTATVFCLYGQRWVQALEIANQIFNSVDKNLSIQCQKKSQRKIEPGALNFIKALKKAKIILGIISNDNKSGIKGFLTENKLEKDFDYYWSSEDYPSKPDPNSIKSLCQKLKVSSSKCAMISDSDSDLLIAKRNSIPILLGYLGAWSIQPEIYEHDHLINHWNELNIQ